MLLFRRIFDFQKQDVQQFVDQRLNRRYTPGRLFPLRAALVNGARETPAKIHDLSASGIALVTDRAAAPAPGKDATVRLTLPPHVLELHGHAAHFRPLGDDEMLCGLSLVFEDFTRLKSYLQLLQPVAIGGTLQAVDPARVQQNEPRFIKQVFRGESDSVLSIWLAKTPGTPLHSFEFRMRDYFVRADAAVGVLEVFLREQNEATHKGKMTTPVFDTTGAASEEIRQLFRWVVPNLPPEVPEDVRVFMLRMAG
ncbi:MAG TPA: PilZ domain-containing protein [Opitutaceae bacterium]|nr:PilZ domain-containing protein [Opitutaceae bacterium]